MFRDRTNAPAQDNLPFKRAPTNLSTTDPKSRGVVGEPKAKRAALTQLSNQFSTGLVIDWARRGLGLKKSSSIEIFEDEKEEEPYSTPSAEINDTETKEENAFDPCPEYDYDAENKNDDFNVPEYAFDIFAYHRSTENVFVVGDYLEKHPGITKDCRALLVDWMIQVNETFAQFNETLYLAVKLVDIYLHNTKEAVPRNELELVACAALFLASKYEERDPPPINDFIVITEESFTREALMAKERRVFDTVHFNLGAPLSYSYLRRYAKVCKIELDTLTLARYILETSLMFYEFVGASESKMAAGAFLLALRMKDEKAEWTPVMHKYSGYEADEVESWVWELNHMMTMKQSKKGVYPKLKETVEKYSQEQFFTVTILPLLPDRCDADRPLSCPN
ncbi:hypothetical protein PFISCL1PPCAC_25423 [Pristionchus fissidentatus]|uniref:G2/mitotic-specific cyclin-B3 n=1 Tax=Pristionchus fissidentatus TaxID=1538716 RepID=A0AAV5WPD7_9BILA|nr:hypothetical protein PFISCL1PPCAC_25423 [Pristionchus fissidentatus]